LSVLTTETSYELCARYSCTVLRVTIDGINNSRVAELLPSLLQISCAIDGLQRARILNGVVSSIKRLAREEGGVLEDGADKAHEDDWDVIGILRRGCLRVKEGKARA